MPLYSFSCDTCGHRADKLIRLQERNEPIECSKCLEEGRESKMIRVVALTGQPKFSGDGFTPKFY